jgi:uncharacterized protein (TIGR00255 family)
MIKSMTSYAGAETIQDDIVAEVEIRSFNSRHLDPVLRLPHGYNVLEEKIKKRLAQVITRGRVEFRLKIKDNRPESVRYEIDEPKAAAFHRALQELKARFDLDDPLSLDHFLGVSGLIAPVEADRELDARWQVIKDCIDQATKAMNAMREKEGAYLRADFEQRLTYIEDSIDRIETDSGDLLTLYQERLKERIAVLTKETVEPDSNRILQEAAFLADRSDISEEIVRARSHVAQFRSIMDSPEPAGRKLNFLLQEFNREFNTMGAKAGNSDISHRIVELKSELEKLREQVQNVE